MPIQEVARGAAAMQRALQLLPSALPVMSRDQFGAAVTIQPMTVWAGNRVFVTDAGGSVAFLMGTALYTQPTGDFIRDQYLAAIGAGGAKAGWLVTVAKVEMVFFTALIGTFMGAMGTAAVATVTLAKMGNFYAKHRTKIQAAIPQLKPIYDDIRYIDTKCPAIFQFMKKHARELLDFSLSASDVAYFAGKLLGGLAKAPEITLSAFLAAFRSALTLTVVLRGPMASIRGNSLEDVRNLVTRMKKEGVTVSDADAKAFLSSPCVRDPEVARRVKDMVTRVDQVIPILDGIARALKIESQI